MSWSITEVARMSRVISRTVRRHHEQVVAERDRLTVLGETVARTIRQLEGGEQMSKEDIAAAQAEHEAVSTELAAALAAGVRRMTRGRWIWWIGIAAS